MFPVLNFIIPVNELQIDSTYQEGSVHLFFKMFAIKSIKNRVCGCAILEIRTVQKHEFNVIDHKKFPRFGTLLICRKCRSESKIICTEIIMLEER